MRIAMVLLSAMSLLSSINVSRAFCKQSLSISSHFRSNRLWSRVTNIRTHSTETKKPSQFTDGEYTTAEEDIFQRIQRAKELSAQVHSLSKKTSNDTVYGYDVEFLAKLNDSSFSVEKSRRRDRRLREEGMSTKNIETTVDRAEIQDAKVRGVLELNPYLCTGCGAPFQSKRADSPGYLEKDKLRQHMKVAKFFREKQEAMKLLDMAGIQHNSRQAEDILRSANIPDTIVNSILNFGKVQVENTTPSMSKGQSKYLRKLTRTEVEELFAERPRDSQTGIEATSNIDSTDIDVVDEEDSDSDSVEESDEMSESEDIDSSEEENESDVAAPEEHEQHEEFEDDEEKVTLARMEAGACICQRCFRLKQYGKIEHSLRPGWSKHELLTPKRFETLLGEIKDTKAVVLCLLDLFDLHGSLLPNLKEIAGKNPIVLAANKIDLFPKDASRKRLKQWIYTEARENCNLRSPKEIEDGRLVWKEKVSQLGENEYIKKFDEFGVLKLDNIHLISCQTGLGVEQLVSKVMGLAKDNGNKIYVMGAANAGKSSFINHMLETSHGQKTNKDDFVPQATVSSLPGTTLDFLKMHLPDGITMIDTPGLINIGQLTAKLTLDELKRVLPMKPVNAVTLRLEEGQCVMIGGLGVVEYVQGKPMFFTFFVSNEVKLHQTKMMRVANLIENQCGKLISPPFSYERWVDLQPFVSHEFVVTGHTWKESSEDLVIAGLGWVSLTGPGESVVKIHVPQGTSVRSREPLLPFEAQFSTAKFTGGGIKKKSHKPTSKTGNGKGYGWKS